MKLKNNQVIIYETADDQASLDVIFQDETVWLTQAQMAKLFDCTIDNISLHLKNIFKSDELKENRVVEEFSITAKDGKRYKVKHYNLDAIIAVGYRVNSKRATKFRIWATQILKEYIIKGFALDDERLKEGKNTYFDELIERVRDIRTSERNFYQKVTDIYATSVDYRKDAKITEKFFATVQNKMHYGIHGRTAAEIIAARADNSRPNMGITCIADRKIRKKDVFVAKNYLSEKELKELNLIVEQYLAYAELQALNNKAMTMKDWVIKLDDFLRFNEKEILKHKGRISKKVAEQRALKEFRKFKKDQDKNYISDFDKATKKYLQKAQQAVKPG